MKTANQAEKRFNSLYQQGYLFARRSRLPDDTGFAQRYAELNGLVDRESLAEQWRTAYSAMLCAKLYRLNQ